MERERAEIIHINVTDFAAAVAVCTEPMLARKAFIIAKEGSSRPVVISVSPNARDEGIHVGMPVATAIRMLPSVTIIHPDSSACAKADATLHEIASHYCPTIQSDSGGHLFLDMQGTSRLFGPPVDCAVRIRNRIHERLGMDIAVAVASNKLVAKVGTRAIRPSGIAQVNGGEEAAFLARQEVGLLPGVGPAIGRLLSVAGFSEIGQVANLDDQQALALLGKRAIALRNAARGIDASIVDPKRMDCRRIVKRVDFAEPAHDRDAIRAAVISVAEDAGLAMRQELMACMVIHIVLFWADGTTSEGLYRARTPMVLDEEVMRGAWSAMERAMSRRVRIRAFTISLQELSPARREPDLFTPEGPTREERLQQAVDATRRRFGSVALTHAAAVFHA